MKGILLINKPSQMTSHDVVNIVRRKLNMKRIGHTGTLDPMVTGVLPICIGKATRVSEYIMEQGKKYRCVMAFGKSTSTYDSYGEDLAYSDITDFTKDEILEAFRHFTGKIEQIPPIYSAVKINGKKLYDYARNGKDIEIPSRMVNIYSLDLISIHGEEVQFDVHCSKGTYIRTLVNDMGIYLGTLAYMKDLVRTQVGNFNLADCISIDDFKESSLENISSRLINIEDSLYNLAKLNIDSDVKNRLINGQKINLNSIDFNLEKNNNNIIDYDNILVLVKDEFIGIGKITENILKMERVLS